MIFSLMFFSLDTLGARSSDREGSLGSERDANSISF